MPRRGQRQSPRLQPKQALLGHHVKNADAGTKRPNGGMDTKVTDARTEIGVMGEVLHEHCRFMAYLIGCGIHACDSFT